MTKTLIVSMLVVFAAAAQVPPFPDVPLPVGLSAVGSFNQLGSPRFTMGLSAIYPVAGQLGIYATTTADVFPQLATDPATHRQFYAVSASIRQGVHKSLLTVGRTTFLVGGDVGPGFSQASPTGINVNLSSSFVATGLVQLTPIISAVFPVRMLYVAGAGWNPVLQAGIAVNVSKLKK